MYRIMIKRVLSISLFILIIGILLTGCGKNNQQPVIGAVSKNTSGLANANAAGDTSPPSIASISAPNSTSVVITFSELVNKQSAETTSNYSIPGLTVVSATLGPDLKTVTLVTTPQGGGGYSVQVSGVKDIYGNSMGAGTTNSSANFAPGNITPTANAGPDQVVTPNNLVTLNGTGSTDGDNDALSYIWSVASQPGGANVSLSSTTAVQPTFTTNVLGSYVFSLIVSDGKVTSNADTVTILIDTKPVANAGPDQQGTTNVLVTLNGAGSADADGDAITYLWSVVTQPNTSAVTLSNAAVQQPIFTPTVKGDYVFGLLVTDARGATSSIDTVTIVVTGNSTPVANAGPDASVHVGPPPYTLNGAGSQDADGGTLTYAWSIVSAPNGSTIALSNTSAANPTFTPNVTGNYTFQLIVSDGIASSNADTVVITAANTAPSVSAGNNNYVATPSVLTTLAGTASDADGDTLTYLWEITSSPNGSTISLSNTGILTPTFTPDMPGQYEFRLNASDGYVTSSATVIFYANTSPNAVASASFYWWSNVTKNVTTYLYGGSSNDPDNDPITYSWSYVSAPSGSTAWLYSSSSATANFTPDKLGTYVFRLTVTDNPPTDNPAGSANKSRTADLTVNVTSATSYVYSTKYYDASLEPYGIIGYSNYIYIADGASSNAHIKKFNTSLSLQSSFGSNGTSNAYFLEPRYIAFDNSGYMYISDIDREDVQKLTSGGSYQDKVGTTSTPGDDDNHFRDPYGIFTDSNYLYIADNENGKIKIYRHNMSYYSTINPVVGSPNVLFVTTSNIYYTTSGGNRVGICNLDGSGDIELINPGASSLYGLYIDEDGYIYLSSAASDWVRKYSPDGLSFWTIADSGSSNGKVDQPRGIYVDSNGYVYVSDFNNHRIQKFVPQ